MPIKFASGFEDSIKVDEYHLNLALRHYFNFEGETGARFWIEEKFAYKGNYCLGLELFDITASRRNELNIFDIGALTGKEVFVSAMYYLPSDWVLNSPTNRWYELMNPFGQTDAPYSPYLALWINQPILNDPVFNVSVGGRKPDGSQYWINTVKDFPLPRGRWFNIKYNLRVNDTNGAIKLLIDNKLICDVENLALTCTTDDYKIIPVKIYHETDDFTPHSLWIDDLQIGTAPTTGGGGLGLLLGVAALLGIVVYAGGRKS